MEKVKNTKINIADLGNEIWLRLQDGKTIQRGIVHDEKSSRMFGILVKEDDQLIERIEIDFNKNYSIEEDESCEYPKLVSIIQNYEDAENNDWHIATEIVNWSPEMDLPKQKLAGHYEYLIETSYGVYTNLHGDVITDKDIDDIVGL